MSSRGWYGWLGAPEVVDTHGRAVAEAPPKRCWALVRPKFMNRGKAYRCQHYARKHRLTCPRHRTLELDARALKKELTNENEKG